MFYFICSVSSWHQDTQKDRMIYIITNIFYVLLSIFLIAVFVTFFSSKWQQPRNGRNQPHGYIQLYCLLFFSSCILHCSDVGLFVSLQPPASAPPWEYPSKQHIIQHQLQHLPLGQREPLPARRRRRQQQLTKLNL